MLLPIHDLATDAGRAGLAATLDRLRDTGSAAGDAAATVAEVLADIRRDGDAALVRYMQRWTDPAFSADRIRVPPEELGRAAKHLDTMPELRDAIARAIDNVTAYQRHVLPEEKGSVPIAGAELGMRWSPVERVGLCVPGGTAVLFSTLVMLAVPALVAGVKPENIHVMSPPPTRNGDEAAGDISPLVLGTAKLLGLSNVYRIGGAQGVAALGFGTARVPQVDLIAGPGNVYVQLAKAQLGVACGTDNGFYGPSEIVTVADNSADPARVAADLLAQAEHDPGKCFLVAWDRGVIDAVVSQIEAQLPQRSRRDAIVAALRDESCAVLTADEDAACDVANEFASEHVNLAVAKPQAALGKLRHAGEVFLGDATPVAAGDYHAGPSHCLPTGTTARFASGVSVYTFLKRTGTVAYPASGGGMSAQTIADVAAMAEAEGLDAHAASVRVRS
ncbi:MAG: histidinol dehydrogenase [Planctomycetota bacterium]